MFCLTNLDGEVEYKMPILSISMLGKITMKFNGEYIENKLSHKAIALICYLITNSEKKISRENLAGLLWADSDEESSRYNLRYSFWSIKRIIHHDEKGEELIISEKDSCYINKRYDFFCDILFLKNYEEKNDITLDELLNLKTLFSGEFLEGLYIKRASEFNDFILFERIIFQNKDLEILKKILKKYEELNQPENCIRTVKEMLAIDLYNEDFAYMLMDTYNKSENITGAIDFYQSFEKNLRKNLNISPSKKLKTLYSSIISTNQNEKKITNNTYANVQKKHLFINTFCLKKIPFFWISDVIGKIVEELKAYKELIIETNYIADLAFIQNKIVFLSKEKIKVPQTVPPVRVINALYELLKSLPEFYLIHIKVNNFENIDSISKDALQYIESNSIEGIEIIKF